MINWFNMPDEGLSNGGLFEVKELEVTENGTYETSGEMYNKVTVNVEGGGGETWNTVFEGNVTTTDQGGISIGEIDGLGSLTSDSIKVTFNGTEYILPKTQNGYGEEENDMPVFTEYPLYIGTDTTEEYLATETAGTYTLKIEEPQNGGNPNTVETVTGTLANPFGDINATELRTALLNKEATGYLTINASALGAGTINAILMSNSEIESIYSSGATISTSVATSTAYYTVWNLTKELEQAQMLSGGNIVNIEQYQDNIPTSLTVVWHPLP